MVHAVAFVGRGAQSDARLALRLIATRLGSVRPNSSLNSNGALRFRRPAIREFVDKRDRLPPLRRKRGKQSFDFPAPQKIEIWVKQHRRKSSPQLTPNGTNLGKERVLTFRYVLDL
jgi:hypothetical protein